MNLGGPPIKRRKVAIACEACRGRKARCDGSKPVCGNCSSRAEQCIYKVSTLQVASTNEYIEKLVSRVAELEIELERVRHPPDNPRQNTSNNGSSPPSQMPPPLAVSLDLDHGAHPPSAHTQGVFQAAPSSVDAMGADAGETPDPGDKFYGSSSTLSFMRQVYSAISPGTENSSPNATTIINKQRCAQSSACFVAPENFSLLPRFLSDYLINLYWERVHSLYPFIHKPTFMLAYEHLWAPAASTSANLPQQPGLGLGGSEAAGPTSLVFHCALNAMLALAMQFSHLPLVERDRLAASCMEKSKNLLKLDLFDDSSIAVVQALITVTQYFQSTIFPNKCWTAIGVACRLAQGLGLHVDSSRSQTRFDPLELEIRKRVWHSCVMLDMVVSMTLGRPAMLYHDTQVSLPTPGQDEDMMHTELEESKKISSVAFYIETIKLFRILGRILSHIYNLNEPHSEQDGYGGFDRLIELDTQLTEFVDQLPKGLQWAQPDKVQPSISHKNVLLQQTHVLHVRFLHLRVLLYRPAFTQYCRLNCLPAAPGPDNPQQNTLRPSTPLSSSFAFHASLTCVQVAIDMAETTNQYSGTETTGAWWYNMFYTRTAAMVILLATVWQPLQDSIGSDTLNAAWKNCRETLLNKLPQSSSVKTCLANLEALHRHIVRYRSLTRSESSGSGAGAGPAATSSMPIAVQQGQFEHDGAIYNNGNLDLENQAYSDQDITFDPFKFFNGTMFSDSAFSFTPGDYGVSLL
ncbi:hypothetical protein K469DRAFT_669687 [Zopfia rhizophila CBS 207.26]|uniref:Zn(2)-C6 fungal-type domain-containing protein n=1 Tax=Zopfia rhizophila CBS 207.26 TaxID=1314779 RepID=A0A6A6DTE2_9PEZI|nr:hypothetical protein K469DRAFT_669687 [Zopfia rhizophila CBS 207.26]